MNALDVDEVVGQLLAAEGFDTVEEIAFVDITEISSIQGFDEDTANEIQSRAREFLARIEAEQDERRLELGVADELREIPGVTTAMLVAFGENDIKSVEDLAGSATDDLLGWSERKDGEVKHFPGALEGFAVSKEEAEALVMQARLKAGWIDSLPEPEPEPEDETEGEAGTEEEAPV